jgi:hypothetical protein
VRLYLKEAPRVLSGATFERVLNGSVSGIMYKREMQRLERTLADTSAPRVASLRTKSKRRHADGACMIDGFVRKCQIDTPISGWIAGRQTKLK